MPTVRRSENLPVISPRDHARCADVETPDTIRCRGCELQRTNNRTARIATTLVVTAAGAMDLVCDEHAAMILSVGGFGFELCDLPPVLVHANAGRLSRGVIEAARAPSLTEELGWRARHSRRAPNRIF